MPRPSERRNRTERVRAEKERERQANEEWATETAEATGKEYDIKARNAALEVLDLLKEFDGNLPTGSADTEEEKLAANFIFLRSLCSNYINRFMNFPQLAEAELERFRVAQDTLLMLNDIVTLNRHPVHKFFHGCEGGLKSNSPSSKEVMADCRVLACFEEVTRIIQARDAKKPSKASVVDMMLEYPAILAQLKNPRRLDNLRDGPGAKPIYQHHVKSCRAMIRWGVGENAGPEQILSYTDTALAVAERPLSFDAAAKEEVQGVARRSANGTLEMLRPRPFQVPAIAPRPSMLAISKLKPGERNRG